jgi:hypothetical protein
VSKKGANPSLIHSSISSIWHKVATWRENILMFSIV